MAPKFCIPLPTTNATRTKFKRKFKFRLADEKNTHSHTIQSALSSAKNLVVTVSQRGHPFPFKYFSPRGQALELYNLLTQFSVEISQGAVEISGHLIRVSDCKFVNILKGRRGGERGKLIES